MVNNSFNKEIKCSLIIFSLFKFMIFLHGLSDSLFIEHLSCEKNLELGDVQINKDLFLSSVIGQQVRCYSHCEFLEWEV